MKSIYLLLLLVLAGISNTQAQQFSWVEKGGSVISNSNSEAYDIKVDAIGNVYSIGYFTGQLIMGTDTLTSIQPQLYISKHSSSGQFIWVRQGGGDMEDYGFSIEVAPNGDVYFTGECRGGSTGGANFGLINLVVTPYHSFAVIGKLDKNGNFVWVRASNSTASGNPYSIYGSDLALDASQNVYLVGKYEMNMSFAPLSISGAMDEGFIAKFNSAGTPIWLQNPSSSWGMQVVSSITVGNNGNLYLAGFTNQYASGLPIAGGRFVCINPQGIYLWHQNIGSFTNFSRVYTSTVIKDAQGDFIVNGIFGGTFAFNGTTITSTPGVKEGFIVKFNATGTPVWIQKSMNGNGEDFSSNLSLASDGGFYESGYFNGSATFGNSFFVSNGGSDAYFCKRSSSGLIQKVFTIGGSVNDLAGGMVEGLNGEVYIGGSAAGNVSLGNQTYSFPNDGSLFIGQVVNILATYEVDVTESDNSFSPHPNPTTSSLTFTYPPLQSSARLILTDALGRTVFQQTLPQGTTQHTADLSRLPEAVYFYQLAAESGSIGSGKVAVVQ